MKIVSDRAKQRLEVVNRPSTIGGTDDRNGGTVQDEQPKVKSVDKKEAGKNLRPVSFKWPWDLDKRLGHYVVDRSYKERHDVERTEVVVKALDEFLRKEGY